MDKGPITVKVMPILQREGLCVFRPRDEVYGMIVLYRDRMELKVHVDGINYPLNHEWELDLRLDRVNRDHVASEILRLLRPSDPPLFTAPSFEFEHDESYAVARLSSKEPGGRPIEFVTWKEIPPVFKAYNISVPALKHIPLEHPEERILALALCWKAVAELLVSDLGKPTLSPLDATP